jgi:DNA repair ATPase RecN
MSNDKDPLASASAGEIGRLISEFNVITYRLEAMEKRLDSSLDLLVKKLDELIDRHNETIRRQALTSQALNTANEDIDKLEKKVSSLESELVKIKITFAERVAYGGIGGAVIAALAEAIRIVTGG